MATAACLHHVSQEVSGLTAGSLSYMLILVSLTLLGWRPGCYLLHAREPHVVEPNTNSVFIPAKPDRKLT